MDALRDAVDRIEARRKTLEVYTESAELASELVAQFSTRNVRVTRTEVQPGEGREFVIVRDAEGEFAGALGLDHFRELLSPTIHPPWRLDEADVSYAEVFDFLEKTVFTTEDRRQLLAVTREIEERAWRAATGRLYAGFQRSAAVADQIPVYDRLARETDLSVRVFVADEWDVTVDESIDVVAETDGEIGQFWFVFFDGGESDLNASGLLAEEREPDRYVGFWTDDSACVDRFIDYLETTYGSG